MKVTFVQAGGLGWEPAMRRDSVAGEAAAIVAADTRGVAVAEPPSAPAAAAALAAVAGAFDYHNSREKRAGCHSSYSRCRSSSAGRAAGRAVAVAAAAGQAVAVNIWPAEAAGAVAAAGEEAADIGQVRARILWIGYS